MCDGDDDANVAWSVSFSGTPDDSLTIGNGYVPLQACMHRSSRMGIYGKPAPQDFEADYEHWKHVINNSYMKELVLQQLSRTLRSRCQLAPVLTEVDRIARP
ncbi:hypothetical protein SADUNF_Sadunf07G0015200 [Salix dunnii]|uniref:Uncharacterized protein n=1 Tax=Salix dunnii TaxID=1413687 RepID=A0A835N235_9ROSI|nr:hypothetical protein SADUNF_Sadunf07G0015200 [Salix dunnii]